MILSQDFISIQGKIRYSFSQIIAAGAGVYSTVVNVTWPSAQQLQGGKYFCILNQFHLKLFFDYAAHIGDYIQSAGYFQITQGLGDYMRILNGTLNYFAFSSDTFYDNLNINLGTQPYTNINGTLVITPSNQSIDVPAASLNSFNGIFYFGVDFYPYEMMDQYLNGKIAQ